MRLARFRVLGVSSHRAKPATLTIDRERGMVAVRLYRSRRLYEMPLWWVADAVIWKVVRAEEADRAKARQQRRRARRRR